GLRVIGRGEDLIGSMVLSGAEEAFLFSNEHFPTATEAFVEAMMRAGEGAAAEMFNLSGFTIGAINSLHAGGHDALIAQVGALSDEDLGAYILGRQGSLHEFGLAVASSSSFRTTLSERLAAFGAQGRSNFLSGGAPNGGASYPPLARPNANSQGNVILGDLDDLGRPTGVTSTITQDMIGTGSSASSSFRPPGFEGGANNHSRGHLFANILGGSGTDA
ncbi:hypothetical protein C7964_101842, partial [Loktanella sp. PT4BL]|uniref:DNA/RNA non-specific endonuclease n=1 Tax=Loktanella sp. PT4BL TaxID=2135611 RepID=UPI000D8EA0D6